VTPRDKTTLTYRDAGVDIDAGDALVDRIKPIAKSTVRPGWLNNLGGFGALFEIPPGRYQQPVLVSGTDGVGTKLKLALAMGKHDSIGIDLVAMCANDIIVQGAEPLFFLDYFASGQLQLDTATAVIEGIAEGCRQAGAALIGGETAEMPGMYAHNDYDLAGFCVGVVEKARIIDGTQVEPGQTIIGLASSGPHSNGYSLIRRIIDHAGADLNSDFNGTPLGEVLLTPTRIYVKPILALLEKVPVAAIAHITGGGLPGNVVRVLPDSTQARLQRDSWTAAPIFDWLQDRGNIEDAEMYRTFNCGVGMVVVVSPQDAQQTLDTLTQAGETAMIIGSIEIRGGGDPVVIQ